jgi:hypothetical protein
MLFLIANVVYHPIQVLRAETHHPITCLPIQQFAIYELVIDVVGARALQFADPIADQKCGRNRDRDMDVRLSAANLVEDETF